MSESKNLLRKKYLQIRLKLDPVYRQNEDLKINAKLKSKVLPQYQSILLFYPDLKKNEVNIVPFLERLFEDLQETSPKNPKEQTKRKLYFVRINTEFDRLETVEIQSLEDLVQQKYNILAPGFHLKASEVIKYDLILVPGTVFDMNGNRIGYGKGYYDKLLKQISGYKVGVCYKDQVVERILTDKFDVPMNEVVF